MRSACLLLVALLSASAPAADPTPEQAEFFEKKVRPVLVEHCYKCHSAEAKKPKGGLRVDGRARLLKGGDSGPAVVPGDPEKSRLIEAVRYANPDLQMPPKGKLPDAAIADLERVGEGRRPLARRRGRRRRPARPSSTCRSARPNTGPGSRSGRQRRRR